MESIESEPHNLHSPTMIDLKALRDNPQRFIDGSKKKNVDVDILHLLKLDEQRRHLQTEQEALRAAQNKLSKETGPKIGQLMGKLKSAQDDEKTTIQNEIDEIKSAPAKMKEGITAFDTQIAAIDPELNALLLSIPLPPDDDVPVGAGSDDNVELSRWAPDGWDWKKSFEENKGFKPRTHIELCEMHGLVDYPRGVKIAGSRSYVLTGDGMRLHQAILRFAFDTMINKNGFTPMSVPVLVREEAMVGTGFFPGGRDQAYHINEQARGGGYDMFLTGTGEVGLMGLHQDEIIDESKLPIKYVTVSTCFRREAGAAGKDTAGLYRIHQFDKVEQVVIDVADETKSRQHHKDMMGFVEGLLKELALPHRLLQCCTGDLGTKNADMIDIECWMPGRGEIDDDEAPLGEFGETHSASRLYDYQCRRLNMRYRDGGEVGKGPTTFCHSLNNTVAASPRILIPILEMYQNADGSITVPDALVSYMNGQTKIG
jgi:seryl-tRNA synthetase